MTSVSICLFQVLTDCFFASITSAATAANGTSPAFPNLPFGVNFHLDQLIFCPFSSQTLLCAILILHILLTTIPIYQTDISAQRGVIWHCPDTVCSSDASLFLQFQKCLNFEPMLLYFHLALLLLCSHLHQCQMYFFSLSLSLSEAVCSSAASVFPSPPIAPDLSNCFTTLLLIKEPTLVYSTRLLFTNFQCTVVYICVSHTNTVRWIAMLWIATKLRLCYFFCVFVYSAFHFDLCARLSALQWNAMHCESG